MRTDLEHRVLERWSTWFDVQGDPHQTAMVTGFEIEDGGFDLVWQLLIDLEPLAAEAERHSGRRFKVLQVKEKLATLRVHVTCPPAQSLVRIAAATEESSRRCEQCGQARRVRLVAGRYRGACDNHAGGRLLKIHDRHPFLSFLAILSQSLAAQIY